MLSKHGSWLPCIAKQQLCCAGQREQTLSNLVASRTSSGRVFHNPAESTELDWLQGMSPLSDTWLGRGALWATVGLSSPSDCSRPIVLQATFLTHVTDASLEQGRTLGSSSTGCSEGLLPASLLERLKELLNSRDSMGMLMGATDMSLRDFFICRKNKGRLGQEEPEAEFPMQVAC